MELLDNLQNWDYYNVLNIIFFFVVDMLTHILELMGILLYGKIKNHWLANGLDDQRDADWCHGTDWLFGCIIDWKIFLLFKVTWNGAWDAEVN